MNFLPTMKLPVIRIKESIEAYSMRAVACLFGCGAMVVCLGSAHKDLGVYFKPLLFILLGSCSWAFIYYLRRAQKEKIALTLNEEGFFYRKLNLPWEVIRSYHTYYKETDDSYSEGMIITLKNGKRVKITVTMLDIDLKTLRKHMETFCANMDIIDEGHIETKFREG